MLGRFYSTRCRSIPNYSKDYTVISLSRIALLVRFATTQMDGCARMSYVYSFPDYSAVCVCTSL